MNRQANLTGLLLILSAVTFWISWFLVGHDPDPSSFAPFIAPAMKRDYNQIKFAFVVLDPAHAMDRRLVGQLDGLPSLRAI